MALSDRPESPLSDIQEVDRETIFLRKPFICNLFWQQAKREEGQRDDAHDHEDLSVPTEKWMQFLGTMTRFITDFT